MLVSMDPHVPDGRWPARRGVALALLAAALFGISTPLLQHAGAGVAPFTTAALLYAGAALVGALSRRPREAEAVSYTHLTLPRRG